MLLSRKWLDEFVHVDANDKDFAEAMTLSGSKVETTEDRGAEISNIVVGTILTMERHPDSDHMWICQLDVGQSAPIQIVTGAWNIHPGDMVPVALDHSTLPGGKKIEKGKLRGVESNGMMCGLYELGLDERDFPYAAIVPAAILNDYHPLDKDKPSIPADIQPGDKVFGPVVCAKILECASQPDYTFHTCLDLGGSTAVPDTICPNLHEGDLVAYNTKTGAICTLEDLHADQKEFPHCIPDGIFVLHEEGIQNGDDIKPIIGADDHVVEFEITPNRPDCLSVIGLAREVAATYQQPLTLHEPEVQGGADGVLTDLLDIETPAADLVPRYTARMVRNVKIAPSPKWMRERLRSMGVRPINNIVDITNYVMLEYGQPMHAFDYRYVKGGHIIVRRAEEGEELTTLDGNVRKLTANHLVIADEHRAVGLAGIMGGLNSEIKPETTQLLFESAKFARDNIRKTARGLGQNTDASAHYEKGISEYTTELGMARALHLIQELGCGEVTATEFDCSAGAPRKGKHFTARISAINAILGITVPTEEILAILKKLSFEVTMEADGDTMQVVAPRYREDIEIGEPDLAEEVIREYGYDHITPTFLKAAQVTTGGLTADQHRRDKLKSAMCAQGFYEAMTLAFYADADLDALHIAPDAPERNVIRIVNPISSNLTIMRSLLAPSLLNVAVTNLKKGNAAGRLFELSNIYVPKQLPLTELPEERLHLGFVAFGEHEDFFAVKGALEDLAASFGVTFEVERAEDVPYLHPGIAAYILCNGVRVGSFGKLANDVQAGLDLPRDSRANQKIFLGEIDYETLVAQLPAGLRYHPLPEFDTVARDLALVADEETPCGTIIAEMKRACKQLADVELFDIYRSEAIGAGKKSMAFTLHFAPENKALEAADVDRFVKKILGNLKFKLGIEIR